MIKSLFHLLSISISVGFVTLAVAFIVYFLSRKIQFEVLNKIFRQVGIGLIIISIFQISYGFIDLYNNNFYIKAKKELRLNLRSNYFITIPAGFNYKYNFSKNTFF
jgi:hypothetical protein